MLIFQMGKISAIFQNFTERRNEDWLLIIGKIYFFLKSECYKSKLGKACLYVLEEVTNFFYDHESKVF